MNKYILIYVMTISLIGGCSTKSDAASFDCNKAKTNIENMICNSSELSMLDEQLNYEYKIILNKINLKDDFVKEQYRWIKDRSKCKDINCLRKKYKARLNLYFYKYIKTYD